MERRFFIKNLSLALMMMKIGDFKSEFTKPGDALMPVLFVGHGSPMNAIEDNEYTRGWTEMAREIPEPKAILCVSAHWQTQGTKVNALQKPETIHDFYGFPPELSNVQYSAPGSPVFASEAKNAIHKTQTELDYEWGLDHGCWSVMRKMFPDADIPTFQLSIDYGASPQTHYEIAQDIKQLRKKGVLIVGSGNIVHNLRLMQWKEGAYDWAQEFDATIKQLIEKGDHQSMIDYEKLGKAATLSIPTNEHYLPLLYTLAQQDKGDDLKFFNEKTTMGSVSMRSVKIG